MRRFAIAALAVLSLTVAAVSVASPDSEGRINSVQWLQSPDGGTVRAQGSATGEVMASVSGSSVIVQGSVPDGGSGTIRLDGDRRVVVSTGTITGSCLGADLTTSSAAGPTIPAGAEYRLCALTDLWMRYDGEAATADAPSEPIFARTCIVRGPYSAERTTTGILPSGATALSGKELVACPVTRPQ